MSLRRPGVPAPAELRPTIRVGESRRFMDRVILSVEDGKLVVVDVAGERHEWPMDVPSTVVLQTDLGVGARQMHGSNDSLLILDGAGKTLVRAPRRPFERDHVAAFCRAHGLALSETERTHGQPAQPPRASGYVAVTVPKRTTVWQVVAVVAGVLLGVLGPLPFYIPFVAGVVVAFSLLFLLS